MLLTDTQYDQVTELIKDVGENCILRHFRNLKESDVSYKDNIGGKDCKLDPVSIADKEAEDLLRDGLYHILPEGLFLGEENYEDDPETLQYLNQNDKPVWVVDPIDGTNKFVAGQPGFGVMIGLYYKGEIVHSWLYEVPTRIMVCDQDLPNYSKPEQKDIYIGKVGYKIFDWLSIETMDVSAPINIDYERDHAIMHYGQLLRGDIDFLVYTIAFPWDNIPGIGLLQHHDFQLLNLDKAPYDYMVFDKGLVIARNQIVADAVFDQIIPVLESLRQKTA